MSHDDSVTMTTKFNSDETDRLYCWIRVFSFSTSHLVFSFYFARAGQKLSWCCIYRSGSYSWSILFSSSSSVRSGEIEQFGLVRIQSSYHVLIFEDMHSFGKGSQWHSCALREHCLKLQISGRHRWPHPIGCLEWERNLEAERESLISRFLSREHDFFLNGMVDLKKRNVGFPWSKFRHA